MIPSKIKYSEAPPLSSPPQKPMLLFKFELERKMAVLEATQKKDKAIIPVRHLVKYATS